MAKSDIEWTEMTWNPTTGCHKVSQGCKFCYAEIMTRRLKAMGQQKYAAGFSVVKIHESDLSIPLDRKKPTVWFVNSMSDLFHDDVPIEFIQQVFTVMNQCPQHTFQVLTKRIENVYKQSHLLTWTPNIWLGTSVEDDRVKWRIDFLTETDAKVKFLSLEPLIGPLPNLSLAGIDWVIVGGESGHKPRPMNPEWVEDIRLQCEKAGVAFFFKQWGGKNKKAAGRLLNGRTYDEMPRQTSAIMTTNDLFASPLESLRPHVSLIEQEDLGKVLRVVMKVGSYQFKRLQSKQPIALDYGGTVRDVSDPIWENPEGGFFDTRKAALLETLFLECCVTNSEQVPDTTRRNRSAP